MPEEKTLDFNGGEKKPSSGAGQPGNNDHGSDNDDIDSEIDAIIKGDKGDDDIDLGDDDDEDTVVLSKKQVAKLQENLKHYKAGLTSVKTKWSPIVKAAKGKPAGNADDAGGKKKEQVKNDDDAPITKADQRKGYEKAAIKEACTDDEVNKNWSEIIKYYSPRHGRDSADDILADIKDAKTLWKSNQNTDDDEEGEDKKSAAQIAADKGKAAGSGSKEGKEKEKKHLMMQKTPIQKWYPKPGE